MRRLLLIPIAIALLGAAKFDPVANERANQDSINYQEVSLVALLANPAQYDGKRVQASGYLTLEFEGTGLHLDKAAYDAGLRKNAVWVERPAWLSPQERARLTNRYATVFATFNASHNGMYHLYSGSLEDVRRVRPTFTTADFRNHMVRDRDAYFRDMLRPGLIFALLIAAITTLIVRLIIRRQARP
jgi:hypothetical protein